MRAPRELLAVAFLVVVIGAGAAVAGQGLPRHAAHASASGRSAPPRGSAPFMTPAVPDRHTRVNGCDPAAYSVPGPWGLCLDGPPVFQCCSLGLIVWSGVVAGRPVDLRGAVPLDPATGRPQSSAVLLLGPHGWRVAIPVARTGAFERRVTFPKAGAYQLGVLYRGRPADLDTFQVAWRYKVVRGPTLGTLLPNRWNPWPADDLMLAAEIGRRAVWTVVLETGDGVPVPHAVLTPRGPVADAKGRVTITYPPTDGLMPPEEIATGLYVQAYADIRPAPAGLAGLPPRSAKAALPTVAPFVRTVAGETYYDVEDAFARMAGWYSVGGPGMPPPIAADPKAGLITVHDPLSGNEARLLLASGRLERAVLGPTGQPQAWVPVGALKPLVVDGQLYLRLSDLAQLAKAVAWAAPDGHGGFLFSDSWIP